MSVVAKRPLLWAVAFNGQKRYSQGLPRADSVQFEPTQQDGKVARVCDGGEKERAEALVKLEGKVRGTGDQRGEQGQVWVAEEEHYKLIQDQRYMTPVVHNSA